MTDGNESLRGVDIEQIGRILDVFDRSSLDFLRVEVGGVRVTAGRGVPPGGDTAHLSAQIVANPAKPAPSIPSAPFSPTSAAPQASARPLPVSSQGSAMPVATPLSGLFYSRPEPGAHPFVQVGSVVEQGATLGLVEVMKVFNAVAAPIGGTVIEVCVAENDLVEFGQVLFRIEPAGS